MKSYIKIYGPPLLNAIKALEKISIDMPEVCIMDTIIASSEPGYGATIAAEAQPLYESWERTRRYFSEVGEVPRERCSKIISRSGEELGEYDFFFEWFKPPTTAQIERLIEKVDEALTPLGVKYTITTKK